MVRTYLEGWKFSVLPKGFWDIQKNRRDFFDWLGKQVGVHRLEDWYKIDIQQVWERGGYSLSKYYCGSLPHALKNIYADFPTKSVFWKYVKEVDKDY